MMMILNDMEQDHVAIVACVFSTGVLPTGSEEKEVLELEYFCCNTSLLSRI